MRSELRIVAGDDADGRLLQDSRESDADDWLPADLAALGEALRDDAERIARSCPTVAPSDARRPRWRFWIGAAASVAIIATIGAVLSAIGDRPKERPDRRVGGRSKPPEHSLAFTFEEGANDQRPIVHSLEAESAGAPTDEMSFVSLSSPELEGAIDLLEAKEQNLAAPANARAAGENTLSVSTISF
jgi:hypothetical protein